jgi:DNA-binding Lrp family transcriptional regulator
MVTEKMKPFFVQIKCELGKAYEVAAAIADSEIASEIYSTAGHYDLLIKVYVDGETDVGRFVNEKVHSIAGVKDTYTLMTFRVF